MFWDRRETYPERRLASIRRESRLVDKDIAALSQTVRSGGEVPAPGGLRSEEWRRLQEQEAEAEMLPDWFPRSGPAGNEPVRSERGFVRDERFVDYLASNFQPSPTERVEDRETPDYRRWILVGLVVALTLLYCLARHWL
jgi:hypothetical protein